MASRLYSHLDAGLTFTDVVVKHWDNFITASLARRQGPNLLDGKCLDIATVVAVSRYGAIIDLDSEAVEAISSGVDLVKNSLDQGLIVYGVNTGFGGSADTRSSAVRLVQRTLIRGLHYGILSSGTNHQPPLSLSGTSALSSQSQNRLYQLALPADDPQSVTTMPASWSRASMLIRLNSLASGASGVQLHTVETLTALLNQHITPQIPLRGSISASGDLSPLSYIAGAMQGRPSVRVWVNDQTVPGGKSVTRADRALAEAKILPVDLGPKEGLAIVNGTAVSAGVAALALHEAHCQAALSQVLTALCVEALQGTNQSFDPFMSRVRPHPGQKDCSRNILAFLSGSKLVHQNDGKEDMTLRQDRYSIRTAPQWIGPVLEDLLLADQQVTVELNSVTDNPLIDPASGSIFHGGNFQAKSISSAMDKTRTALQTIGRMLFSQCTELINPATNRGLPANLVVDNPSTSCIWKGTDIMVAALASELGFLAGPVAPHVQTAEMGNQSLNSLALISARYTLTAADVLAQLSAAHLMALCQAFDLHALQKAFLDDFYPQFVEMVSKVSIAIPRRDSEANVIDSESVRMTQRAWEVFKKKLELGNNMDTQPRMLAAVEALQPLLLSHLPVSAASVQTIREFSSRCIQQGAARFEAMRSSYRANPDATPLLGKAGKRMYSFVRKDLGVPFFGEEELSFKGQYDKGEDSTSVENEWPTVGGYITKIYEAMRTGVLYAEVIECFREAHVGVHRSGLRARL